MDQFWAAVTGNYNKPEYHHKKCKKVAKEIFNSSADVQFLEKQLELRNCNFNRKLIKCQPCDFEMTGGFHPEKGIILCENGLDKGLVHDTIVHEMIHFFDNCVYEVEKWENCYIHACSEIRAAQLSGDCRWYNEIRRGHYDFTNHKEECVKRRAILSLKANPNCQENTEAIVESVYKQCSQNYEPFEKYYSR